MKNPDCPKCGEMMSKGWIDFVTKYSCRHCEAPQLQAKDKECECCRDLDSMDKEYPDEPHHGAMICCDACGAEYWEPYGCDYETCNAQAQSNHPELKKN